MGDDQLSQEEVIGKPARTGSEPSELQNGPSSTRGVQHCLYHSESGIRCLPEDISDLVCTVDAAGIYRYLNPSYRRVLGYEPEALLGESLFARIHPDDQARVKTEYNGDVRTRSNLETEFRYQCADGHYVWLRSAWSFLFDVAGAFTGVTMSSHDITHHKQTQAELVESEQRFRTLAEATFEGIAVTEKGVFLDVNEQLANMLRYEQDELIGMSVLDLAADESRALTEDSIGSHENRAYECVAVDKDGTAFPVEVRGRTTSVGNRQVRLTAIRDISSRKRIEEALSRSEERLRFALEGTSDGIWDWDLATDVVYFSPRYYTMLGYEPGEFPPAYASWRSLLHPDDVVAAECAVKEAVARQAPFAIEFRLKAKNGEWVWILGRGKVVESDAEGKASRVAGSHADITELKRTQEALEKRILALTQPLDDAERIAFEDLFNLSEIQRFQDLYAEAFGVAALVTHPDGTPITRPTNFCDLCSDIIRKTPKGAQQCEYSDSIIGRYNPVGPNIGTCLSAGLLSAAASITVGGHHVASMGIGQVRNEAQDEEKIVKYAIEVGVDMATFREAYRRVPVMAQEQFEKIALLLFEVANQLSAIAYQNVQQARFIAQLKRAEEEILELNESLEQRVRKRTAELEAATKELEAFSYSVSHDLRAPLRAIHGYSRILEEDYQECLDDEGSRVLAIVRNEAERMGKLIDDLLRFSRLNKQPLQKVKTHMTSLVREVFDELYRETPNREVDFRLERLPVTNVDPSLMRQLWVNLLGNALKFTSGRERSEIMVSASTQGKEVIYSVKDNGVGFNMQHAEKLFGVFQRLHGQDEFEGSGVGLSLVQRIVHRHGGRIWAEAEVDQGAMFHFTLAQ